MDADVAELVRAERLLDAAALSRDRGDLATASELFERACSWAPAAECALLVGDGSRALFLAALGGADETAAAALASLDRERRGDVSVVGDKLRARGQPAWAARVYEVAGETEKAAAAWVESGEPLRGARLLESAGADGVVRAARVLEGALRREPERPDLLLALGSLLARSGKAAAALRVLQRVPPGSAEEPEALESMVGVLGELGMNDAKAEVAARLASSGRDVPAVRRAEDGARRDASVLVRLYGRYDVVREVSSTATARVLECVDVLRGDRVALKVFAASEQATRGAGRDALAHFVREARVLAQLAHPNVVPLRDVIEQAPAVALEWMPGGTLEQALVSQRPPPSRAADVACAVLAALGEAHRHGVVHRDVKPANILFDAAGTARLSDFGVAHLGDLSVTATAGSFGSFAYMSPEQREGRPASAQSDIYSVGVVLLEMLTGRRGAAAARDDTTLEPSLHAVHRYLDERHDAAVARLLARDPGRRPPDAFSAARSIAELPWPREIDDTEGPESGAPSRRASVRPPALRLELLRPDASGVAVATDHWLERRVTVIPLSPERLAVAAAFSRAGHRALQPVLRVDRDASLLWLGAVAGEALTRPLDDRERIVLDAALGLLHGEGVVHGSVSRDAIRVGPGGPILLFPFEAGSGADAGADRRALGAL
jgi:serine/threonine-protein kinase